MATVFSWVSHVPVLHVTPVAAQGKSWEGWGWVGGGDGGDEMPPF